MSSMWAMLPNPRRDVRGLVESRINALSVWLAEQEDEIERRDQTTADRRAMLIPVKAEIATLLEAMRDLPS